LKGQETKKFLPATALSREVEATVEGEATWGGNQKAT
jgi:hypothetical protein